MRSAPQATLSISEGRIQASERFAPGHRSALRSIRPKTAHDIADPDVSRRAHELWNHAASVVLSKLIRDKMSLKNNKIA